MKEITVLTTILRDKIMVQYNNLRNEYIHKVTNEDINDTYEDMQNDEFEENIEDNFEDAVLLKLKDYIKNSSYKNIFYMIILNDSYEYLKSKNLGGSKTFDYEDNIIAELENLNLSDLINSIQNDDEIFFDYITIFLEYQFITTNDSKQINKKIIELSNNKKYLDKFNIHILDDIENEYKKTR